MRTTINIATMPSRIDQLGATLESLKGQADEIRLYLNGFDYVPTFIKENTTYFKGEDLTDNGKFFGLSFIEEDEYYFTLDDDIIYPPTFVRDMIQGIETYGTIVTMHGRILVDKDVSYYRGHEFFHCANTVEDAYYIDVSGTGVTAFDTRYFKPTEIYSSSDKCMSDIVFGLEAKRQGKKIVILPHEVGYIRPQVVEDSIYSRHSKNEARQIELANEIFDLKKYFE
jgi:hypothetical protein